MATTAVAGSTASSGAPARALHDTRRPSRWGAALLMPVGPAAIAWLRFTLPYDTTDDATTMLTKVADHLAAHELNMWLGVVAAFTLVPGAFAVVRLVRPTTPRLAMAAGVLLVAGYLGLIASAGPDLDALAAAKSGIAPAVVAPLLTAAMEQPQGMVLITTFVVGHIVGTVLLGIALWRSRAVHPAWALVMALSQPVHLVAAMTGNHPLDLVGWGGTALAMGAAAVAVVRTRDDDWDVPPRQVRRAATPR